MFSGRQTGDPTAGGPDIGVPLLPEGGAPEPKSMRLGFVAGTIPEDKLNAFERLLFRATRGNMYLKWSSVGSVVDPTTTEKVEKAVFVVFFAGERARSKILKVRAGQISVMHYLLAHMANCCLERDAVVDFSLMCADLRGVQC